MTAFGDIGADTALIRALHFSGVNLGRGSTAPTDVLLGTSPEVPVLLFDAVAETAGVFASFFPDMDLGSDMTLRIQFALVNGQLDADALDLTIDYVVPVIGSTGDGPTKVSSQVLTTRTLATAEGLAAGDVYEITATVAFDDATNPFAGGAGIAWEIHLTNLVDVAAIHVLDADLEYVALY